MGRLKLIPTDLRIGFCADRNTTEGEMEALYDELERNGIKVKELLTQINGEFIIVACEPTPKAVRSTLGWVRKITRDFQSQKGA